MHVYILGLTILYGVKGLYLTDKKKKKNHKAKMNRKCGCL